MSFKTMLKSIFGKDEPIEEQETVKVNSVDYEIPAGVKNMLALIYQHQKLTAEEQADLENQIKTLGSLGFTHYVIHTHGRGETNPIYPLSGDRYWELDYLPRAQTMDIINDTGGYSRKQMQDRGLEPIVYENLLS